MLHATDSGFKCTYCGAAVAMTQQQRIQQAQQQQQHEQEAEDGSIGSSAAQPDAVADAQAKAVAFKDRLVEYDRHAQKRTTVIDDQSDFFEIETNAWLTEEVSTAGGCVMLLRHAVLHLRCEVVGCIRFACWSCFIWSYWLTVPGGLNNNTCSKFRMV